ncbi:MAG: 50S ribosomal protein L15 [candidate division WOR-3 bacterium]
MGTELSKLRPPKGSRKGKKRVGRGPGSGMGTYSTRGLKGQNSRSGGGVREGFEGGQTPLIKRIPKKGFNRVKNYKVSIVNIEKLDRFKEGEEITLEKLRNAGLAGKRDRIKILGRGSIDKKLSVHANEFSKSAVEKIEKAGGKIIKDV